MDSITFGKVSALPGSTVRLTASLSESLPAGRYKISGHIVSDTATRTEFTNSLELTRPVGKAPKDDTPPITSWATNHFFDYPDTKGYIVMPTLPYSALGKNTYAQHKGEGDKAQISTGNNHRVRSGHWAVCNAPTHPRVLFPSSSQKDEAWDSRIAPECFGGGVHDVLIEIQRPDDDTEKQPEPGRMEMPAELVLQIMPRM